MRYIGFEVLTNREDQQRFFSLILCIQAILL